MSITSVVNDTVTSVSLLNAQKPLPPTISNYSVGGLDDTALDPAGGQTVQINGTGFLAGATITFDGNAVAVVTYVNPNRLTFTSPAKSAGTYTIYVVNPDGGTAIFIPGIIYSLLPTWTTSAGSLGSYYETTSISNTVVASGDAPITYSLFSGSLPTGATLYANGVITGTAPVDSSSTTYSFTIEAIDAQLQGSTRSFSLTINTDVVTWVSPANATTYTSVVDSAIANVTLSATDAAGYAVTYTANALPTGLSLTGANISGTPTVIADSSTLLTATAATTNRTAVRTINWSITVANDPFFEYNTLLIPGASTTFVDDASTNNFAITINGDTRPNSLNPYTPGYYSNYFDGTGDYLTVPANAAFGFGTGDFTIETWTYVTGTPTTAYVFDMRFGGGDLTALILQTNGSYIVYVNGETASVTPATSYLNRWVHWAIVRSSGTVRVYVDGIQSATFSAAGSIITSGLALGARTNLVETLQGYISNFRIVKGTAVYTSAFTPSTTPLTAISGTSLLTCQSNRFIDNSTNNFTITVAGNTSINSFDPFVPNSSYSTYGSGYFDGTGDYLNTPSNAAFTFGTGDLTLECWIYQTATSSSTYRVIFADNVYGGSGGYTLYSYNNALNLWKGGSEVIAPAGTITLNVWNHVAWTRSGSSNRLFINGTQVGATTTDSTNYTGTSLYISASVSGTFPFNGYITDVRAVKGTAVYTTTFTPPSAPLTAISGTSLLTLQNNQSVNNNVFLDNSTNNFFVTRNGNTTQGTFSPYGGNWSNYFDGTGDYLRVPYNAGFAMASSNFTIEYWVYPTVLTGDITVLAAHTTDTNGGYAIGFDGTQPRTWVNIGGGGSNWYQVIGPAISLNTWNHIALVRNGSSFYMYTNGVPGTVYTNGGAVSNASNSDVTIGVRYDGTGNFYTGYVSNTRIVKGTALYTTTFTPSTTPLTTTSQGATASQVSLLTCQSNRFIDNSTNNVTITKNGDTSVQRFSPFNPSSVTPTSYSGYFDGTGDVLTPPANNVFAFGTDPFCIEAWIFNNVLKNYSCLVTTRPNNSNYADAYHIGWDSVGGVSLYVNATSTTNAPNGTITTGQWQHFVCCRDSSNRTAIFVNGTRVGNDTVTSNFTRNLLGIGDFPTTPAEGINGYISNLRLVKGNSVYDPTQTTITVPTSPLTTTSQGVTASTVSILTCQSTTFIDNSTNNFTITAVGNTQPTIQNPFGVTSTTTNGYTVSTIGGSGYFDGTGDYLTAPSGSGSLGTGNFTVEGWIYCTANPVIYSTILSNYSTAGTTAFAIFSSFNNSRITLYVGNSTAVTASTTITFNTWIHIAAVRNSGVVTLYVNGVGQGTVSYSGSSSGDGIARIGCAGDAPTSTNFQGYISDTRWIIGTALYTSNFVPPAAPLTAIQNTSLLTSMTGAGIYDATMINDMETFGSAQLSTAVSKFGGSSVAMISSGDYCKGAQNNVVDDINGGDFTIEFWVNFTSLAADRALISKYGNSAENTGGSGYVLQWVQSSSVLRLVLGVGGTTDVLYTWSWSPLISTWYHVAVTRSGTSGRAFVNGTQIGSTLTLSTSDVASPNPIQLGKTHTAAQYLLGYMDDVRITKGYARYTSNFTPPALPFPIF